MLWATQRLDEIRGFAARVTLLDRGTAASPARSRADAQAARAATCCASAGHSEPATEHLAGLLGARATVVTGAGADRDRFRLEPGESVALGDALAALAASGLDVLACRPDRSELEEAFLALTGARA